MDCRPVGSTDMRAFWDKRARENAYYYVDNRLDYRSLDMEQFWADGEADVDRVLALLGATIRPADTVVEIGCGVGRLTRVLAARAERVIAFDVSEDMLALAREHNQHLDNVVWQLGNGSTLGQVPDATADACFSHVVFQHIPDPQITLQYVAEMGRVLRSGGWSAFQVSNDPTIHRPRQTGKRLLGALSRAPQGQNDPAWLGSAVDLDDLRRAAADGGMAVERVVGEGTQFCLVLTAKGHPPQAPAG